MAKKNEREGKKERKKKKLSNFTATLRQEREGGGRTKKFHWVITERERESGWRKTGGGEEGYNNLFHLTIGEPLAKKKHAGTKKGEGGRQINENSTVNGNNKISG